MPKLIPTNKFIQDIETLKNQKDIIKKVAKTLAFLETNPRHPGLHIERITNDITAWSVRVDIRYRISLEPESTLPSGMADWSGNIILLRLLDHDDLYKKPR